MSALDDLRSALKGLSASKQDAPEEYFGLLGTFVNGVKTVTVPGQPDYVYVRLRGVQSELVKAFNDSVAPYFGLPVKLVRHSQAPHYLVVGRDISAYKDWGGEKFAPLHGSAHSFSEASPAADTVWVYKHQFMPLMLRPTDVSGSMSGWVEADWYQWNDEYKYFPGTGTVSFMPAVPATGLSRFISVYIDGDTNTLGYLTGTTFDSMYPPVDITSLIPLPTPTQGVPSGAVLLHSTTTQLSWPSFYDTRALLSAGSTSGAELFSMIGF